MLIFRFAGAALAIVSLVCLGQTPSSLRIVVVEGHGALNNIRLHQARDPVVRVEYPDGRPVPGATVSFLLPEGGPGGRFLDGGASATALTDDGGLAAGGGLRPNSVEGQFAIRVTAWYGGQTASAAILQTNLNPIRTGRKKWIVLLAAAGAGVAGAALAAKGGGGTGAGDPLPPAAQQPGTTIVAGSPVWGPPR